MGNCLSDSGNKKVSVPLKPRQSQLNLLTTEERQGFEMSQKKYDDAEVEKLKKELRETPQIFVLNNLLMSVMFFENFEKEKHLLMHSSRTTMASELNSTLLAEETIECVTPDVIFENVNKNVRFRRTHGANKIEPIVPKRMFVVNDNIEVMESKHTPQYSTVDKPSYQVAMEQVKAKHHEGFVKLKCAPVQPRIIEQPDVDLAEPKAGPSKVRPEEVYEYSTFARINTPKPLAIESFERRDTLPKSCFTQRKMKKYDIRIDEESDEESEPEPKIKEELFETIIYISSKGFMTHFQNAVFPNSLGQRLGFDVSEISLAKAIPGRIFCNLQDVDEELTVLPCEIIPSVAIQWPFELAFEFHDRAERPTMWDKFGGEYRWPTPNMINEIRSLNCVLIPRGYIPKRDANSDQDIEWEVAFPKAQRYLDTHMSHTQIRAFLFLLTLYKSYIEPSTKRYDGLLVDHIRTHMYWECESNPRDWPEHRLGSKLVLVIENLIKKLSVGKLPDFFLARRNTFLNVPNKHLAHAQKIFHDVLESPAVYFIGALRNLRYSNPKFYPLFDFRELYKILTSNMSPKILDIRPPNLVPKNRRPKVDGDANYRKEINWKIKQEMQNRQKFLQKEREKKQKLENLNPERRASVDSIDYEAEVEDEFDRFKIRALLLFFIHHFIEMARKSRRLATQRQALFYLKQAYYLKRILEDFGLKSDAQDLDDVIMQEQDISKKLSITESMEKPPMTPKRASAQFTWDVTQQVKGNNINLNNLSKSYNSTAVPNNYINKVKKHPSNAKLKTGVLKSSFSSADQRKSGEARRSVVGFSESIEIRS